MRRRLFLTLLATAALAAAPAPASAAVDSCDKYASVGGSDAFGSGARDSPWQTVDKLLANLDDGQAGCLIGSGIFDAPVDMETGGGTPSAPVTLRSENLATRATIRGLFWVRAPVTDLIITGVKLDGGTFMGIALPIDGDRITLLGNEITRDSTNGACLYGGNEGGDIADDLRVEGNRIHNCANGVQLVATRRATVTDNTIFRNAGRGVQLLPDADDSTVEQNVIAYNSGQGVQFGGDAPRTSDRNAVRRNVITNNTDQDLGDEGAAGTGNLASDNCINQGAEIEMSSGGFAASGNTGVAAPGYASAGSDNFTLNPGGPCGGKGPLPGVALLPADSIGTRTARLRGEVNPHFQTAESYFRYGPNGTLTSQTAPEPRGDESVPAEVRVSLDNLQPATTYTYRLVARNPSGGERVTGDGTFTTAALPDRDGDGVPDESDVCDELVRGAVDTNGDGCPDDSDGDGVFDDRDGCDPTPRGPIDRDGDGCPDDRDGDGIIDAEDRCRDLAAGRFDNPPNGCPGPQPIVGARNARVGFFLDGRGAIRVVAVRLRSVEKGARVRISCRGCKVKGNPRVRRAGPLNFTRGLKAGLKVRRRSVIVVRVTKRGKAGRVFELRWNQRQRTWLDTERCIPIGTSKAQPLRACGDRTK